ncbi:MAG: hypothetical protein B5M53_08940 [Candidatus Cloacimonas sp. 4484_209]|nr:MAG: hypothetical protein B5M53_08940 [Candidatus Cloacimonas sp. 4484_209]
MVSPILLIALPLFFAFLIPLFKGKGKSILLIFAILINLIISILIFPSVLHKAIIVKIANFLPPVGINLFVGPIGITLSVIISGIGLLVSIYLLKMEKRPPLNRFYALYLLMISGATGMSLTGDIFNMFVFLEITTISAYGLTAYGKDKAGLEAGMKYLLIGSLGANLVLIGVILLYATTGSLNMADIAGKISMVPKSVLSFIFVLFFVGFGIEAELFPLNGWSPDAMEGAPHPISVMFSSVISKVGLYAFFRFVITVLGLTNIKGILLWFGVATLFVGELAALRQRNLKRLLAYSSIAQLGFIFAAIAVGTSLAVKGAMFHIINHALLSGMMFAIAGFSAVSSGDGNIDTLKGLGNRSRLLAFAFTIGALGTLGFPLLNGFWSKFMMILGMIKGNAIVPVYIILFASVIETVYYLRLVYFIYFIPSKSEQALGYIPFAVVFPVVIFLVFVLILGIYPSLVNGVLNGTVTDILNRSWYITSVFGG